jgi:hypothetical protein
MCGKRGPEAFFMKKVLLIFVVVLVAGNVTDGNAEELIREFSGSRSTETAEFEAKAPWLIDWRVNSEYPSTMGISVSLAYGVTGYYAGKVFKTKTPGNGVRLIQESGRFRFKVDAAVADWTLKVIQLTPEEAAQYTPKENLDY